MKVVEDVYIVKATTDTLIQKICVVYEPEVLYISPGILLTDPKIELTHL